MAWSDSWRIARRYADAPSAPWISHFAGALQAFSVAERPELAAGAAARESRATFRVDIAAVVLADADAWRVLAWDGLAPPALTLPRTGLPPGYRPGEIIEIRDLGRYAAPAPHLAALARGEYSHLIAAGFGCDSRTSGYLTFVSRSDPALSDDELTLLSLFALATGIALDRFAGYE